MSLQRSFRRAIGSHDLRVARPLYITSRHFASGDYGSGCATKGTSEGHNTAQPARGQKRSFLTYPNLQFRRSDVMLAEKKPKSTEGLSPKILNESPPSKENEPEEVKKHNEEIESRSERAHEKVNNEDAEKDKVGPGFWKGQGGKDRQP